MKAKIIFLLCGVLLMGAISYYKYKELDTESLAVSIIIDKTDSMARIPDTHTIMGILSSNETSMYRKVRVYITPITGFDNTKTEVFYLPASKIILFENPKKRQKLINAFLDSIQNRIDAISSMENGRDESNIYTIVVKEANRMATLSSAHKQIVVFSDMAENSPLFSVYQPKDLAILEKDKNAVIKRFTDYTSLSDLKGINLDFIFEPIHREDDIRFTLMSKLFADLFSSKGATVYYGSSLNH